MVLCSSTDTTPAHVLMVNFPFFDVAEFQLPVPVPCQVLALAAARCGHVDANPDMRSVACVHS